MDYSNFQDWEIKELAKRNGQTAEEWKAEQDALAGKQTVPEETTPPTEPEKKNTAAGDSSSADTSLESPETDPPAKTEEIEAVEKPELSLDELEARLNEPRYVEFENGHKVYEDQYSDRIANTKRGSFPETFEEYAKAQNLEIKYGETRVFLAPGQSMLDEVTVIADKETGKKIQAKNTFFGKLRNTLSPLRGKAKQNKFTRAGEEYLKAIAGQNKHTNKQEIILTYFGLTKMERFDEDDFIISPYEYKDFATAISGSGGEEGDAVLTLDQEAYKKILGEKKYNQWLALNNGVFTTSVTQDMLDNFNISEVQDGTIQRVVERNKILAAEGFVREMGVEDAREMMRYLESPTSFDEFIVAEMGRREKDAEDFEKKFGRPLLRIETVQGRTYIPPNAQKTGKGRGFDEQFTLALEKYDADLKEFEILGQLYDEQYTFLETTSKNYEKKLKEIQSELEAFTVDGKPVIESEWEARKYNSLIEQYNNLLQEEQYVSLSANIEKLEGIRLSMLEKSDALDAQAPLFGDLSIANDAPMKMYGLIARMDQAIDESFIGAPIMLAAHMVDWISRLDFSDSQAFRKDGAQVLEWASDYNAKIAEGRGDLAMKISSADLNKGIKGVDGGAMAVQILGDNSPSIIVTTATMGVGAMPVAGLTTAQMARFSANLAGTIFFGMESGGYLSEMALGKRYADQQKKKLNKELDDLRLSGYSGSAREREILEEIEYNDNYLKVSELQLGFSAFAYGGIAGLFERTSQLGFIKNYQKYSRAVGYEAFSKYLSPYWAQRMSTAFTIPKTVLSGATINLLEEGGTQIGQNFVDVHVGKFKKSYLDGLDTDFVLNTLGQGLAISGPQVGMNLYSGVANIFTNRAHAKKMNGYREKLLSIQTDLQTDKLTKEQRIKLRAERRVVLSEMNLAQTDVLLKLPDMDAADVNALISIDRDLNSIYQQAAELGEQGEVGSYGKKQLKVLKNQAAELEAKKDELLGKNEAEIQNKYKDAANPAQAVFNYNLFRRSLRLAQVNNNYNLAEIRSMQDLQRFFNNNPEISQDKRAEITQYFLGELNEETGQRARDVNALEVDGKIIVFSQFIEDQIGVLDDLNASIAAVSPLHELGHIKTRQSGVLKDSDILEKANGITSEVRASLESKLAAGKISQEDFDIAIGRLDSYEKSTSDDLVNIDEAFQLVADLINTGAIDKNSFTSLYNFKSFTARTVGKLFGELKWTMQLNSADDIFNFVSSWSTQVAEGGRIIKPQKEETDVKQSIAGGDLLQTINDLVPETVQTQEDFFDRKVFNPIYNNGNLHPAIANYIRNKAASAEEAQKIIESVADRLINFNPAAQRKSGEGRITLGEFIFSNVNFGQRDARKALFEESQERAQTESTDSEQARQIKAAETTTTQQTEAPTYKNLLERRVLASEVVEAIRNKVKSTVRVMKTRMDQPVSKNVTVKPYIAEIKKTMGKQADIDLKKAMGGLKDGQLRKFLLKHKAAILENMTTTYLMTAMPNAVQKKVNGVFTSDWKGKKIDRETTAPAGRTSGAEIVRRLPNASTRLSDADYLSNFFTEDGKLIRGRKESLSKAMAEEISFDIINEALQDPNSEIRKALEQRQDLLGAELFDNYVTQVVVDIERGNVKASISLVQLGEIQERMGALKNIISRQNAGSLTKTRLINALTKVFEDNPSDLITEKDIKAFANESFNSIKRYFSKPEASDVDFATFVEEGNKLAKSKSNLMLMLDIAKDALKGGYKALFEDGGLISRQRGLSLDFNANLIASKGEAGLILALKWMRGHQTTSGKIGKGRMQIYAGVTDFIDNNLNTIPGIEIKYKKGATTVITEVLYNGKVINNWKKRIESPAQTATRTVTRNGVKVKVPISKQTFAEQYDQRLEAAREAWTVLTDYLAFVNENGNAIDWVMTMMSLKSNMSSMLKAAAPVKYYHNGAPTAKLRYEHVVPTEYMVLKLTQHFKGKAINLDALRDKYNVAIIPIKMDDNFNILVQSQMNSDFNLDNDIEVYRYYNKATLGFKNMESVEVIGGDMKGRVIGESWVKFNESVNVSEAVSAIKNIKQIQETKTKSKVNLSAALSDKFNQIIERKTGVQDFKTFSRIQAQMRGKGKGRFKFFVAPGADDFRGLVHYTFAGQGKQGEKDMAFFEEKLMVPYFKGIAAIDGMRQQIKRDFKAVKSQFKEEYKLLSKKIGDSIFTYDHALRVYMWNRQGIEVEGLSQRDQKLLLNAIEKNPELASFADALLVVARRDEWPDPVAHWEVGSVLADLNSMTEKIGRKKFLEEFIENADVIFSEENLNKIEAIFGTRHREAIEDSLYAMKNGTNRPSGANRQVNAWLNWINGSTGAIMFFNRRSALLQMLSFTNFINWSDNNMVKAAGAFANQKQYWSDFAMIFNSDKLKERRGGLKQDVSDSEIAAIAKGSKNSPQAILAYLLKIGFTPTQIADSMAIATGGAMFYRNRVNTYLKQGMDKKAAEEQAFLDFSMKSDVAQQSSDPALVSQQQRSVLGRLILAFANTPMQYTRLMKKAGQDLINGRGRPIENISKIAYYGVIQNFIFSALQSAMFAMFFDDDEENEKLTDAEREKLAKKEEQKSIRVVNSMLDTILRGSGVYGAVASTIKNAIMEYNKQEQKGFMGDHTYTLLAAAGISPPIQSKMRKVYSAIQTSRFERDNVEARGWAVTADGKLNLGPNWSILGNVLSGVTNVPLDRVVDELRSISEALDERNKAWQRIALGLGWKTWDVGVRNEEADLIKQEAKEARKQEGIRKAKETRRINAQKKKEEEAAEAAAAFEAWEKEFVKSQRKNK